MAHHYLSSSSSTNHIKQELADHIYKYLCHEAQYSDLSESARESLTQASECIGQAYRLNVSNTSTQQNPGNKNLHKQDSISKQAMSPTSLSNILPDELLRIFTRHKEFLSQTTQKDSNKYPLRNDHQHESSSPSDKPDIRVNSNPLATHQTSNDPHHQIRSHHHHKNSSTSSSAVASPGGTNQNESASSSAGSKLVSHLLPGSGHHHSIGVSVHQKNLQRKLKQKLTALIKKFRTDGRDFDNEEQYREALERELMKAAAVRGTQAIEELLEEDIDDEAAGETGSEQEDWDNISELSTPKPSLRPFFSSTTLDKI